MTEYVFRENVRFQKGARATVAVAQVVGEHLEMLRVSRAAELTPELVIDEAQNPNSPLHQFFEWDDTEAARQHRLMQARGVIRAVAIRYRETPDDAAKTIRAFVSVRPDDKAGQRYTATVAAMSDEQQRREVVRRAWGELQGFRKRYGDLLEFAQLFASLEEVEAALPPVIRDAA